MKKTGNMLDFLLNKLMRQKPIFFKKRIIFEINQNRESYPPTTVSDIVITTIDNSNISLITQLHLNDQRIFQGFTERLESKNWFGICAVDLLQKKAVGYEWIVFPLDKNVIWHDSLPIKNGEACLCNVHVAPEYRGKNIYPLMVKELLLYSEPLGLQNIFSVVEKRNLSSIKSNTKTNKPVAINILVKCFGKNVFSIVKPKNGIKAFVIPTKKQL